MIAPRGHVAVRYVHRAKVRCIGARCSRFACRMQVGVSLWVCGSSSPRLPCLWRLQRGYCEMLSDFRWHHAHICRPTDKFFPSLRSHSKFLLSRLINFARKIQKQIEIEEICSMKKRVFVKKVVLYWKKPKNRYSSEKKTYLALPKWK